MKLASAIILFVLGVPACAFSQGVDPLGSGKATTLTIPEIPDDLVAFQITSTQDSLRSLMLMSFGGGTIPGENESHGGLTREFLVQLADVLWAPKDQIIGSGEFMVGYKLDLSVQSSRMSYKPSDLRLRLTYMRRNSVISITPREDFAPSVMKQLAKESGGPSGTQAERVATLSNLKQVSLGCIMLTNDTDDIIPYVQGTPQLFKMIEPYTKNQQVFRTMNPKGGSFRFNMSLAGSSLVDVISPAQTVMFYESETWADGKRCVSYVDGHAKVVSADEWQALQATLQLKLKKHGKPLPPSESAPRVK